MKRYRITCDNRNADLAFKGDILYEQNDKPANYEHSICQGTLYKTEYHYVLHIRRTRDGETFYMQHGYYVDVPFEHRGRRGVDLISDCVSEFPQMVCDETSEIATRKWTREFLKDAGYDLVEELG